VSACVTTPPAQIAQTYSVKSRPVRSAIATAMGTISMNMLSKKIGILRM
jgi:hypothetical protein